jgi:aminoglycoside phosphotransferase (APT) family kinase protein
MDEFALGRMTKRLHGLPAPDIDLVAQRGRAASEVVAELTAERIAVVARLAGPLGPVPAARRLQHLLAPIDRQPRLLHMDLRPANYLCADGHLLGLIDWSNSLKADPLLELARLEEYGGLSDDFAAGYELDRLQRAELEGPTGLCCRLYTAAMLAVVFLSEAPDPGSAAVRVAQLKALLAKLAASTE